MTLNKMKYILSESMDIRDFEDNFKFKLYLPVLYAINWALMIFGPFLFPLHYQTYYLCAIGYLAFRSVMTAVWTTLGCFSTNKLLNAKQSISSVEIANKRELQERLISQSDKKMKQTEVTFAFLHAFIIPNYKEDEWVLEQTLNQIASHPEAVSRYLIFLAMQDHEPDSQKKAHLLIQQFKNRFRLINYTMHALRKHEQRGKAANVSWCAQHLQEVFFKKEEIHPQTVILTIIDADSLVPAQYIQEVNKHLKGNSMFETIFEPCQMFIRNQMEVPAITRTYDISHGMVQFSNLFSLWNTSFPLSNYSLSFKLAKRIGFWDTCPDAIGEDFHTTIKAFTKTRGEVRTVSIFTPFNQLNIRTGRGTFADLAARFWQAQRHGRGCADAAYCLKHTFSQGLTFRMLLIYFQVIQITTLPAVLPWCMIGSTILRYLHPELADSYLTGFLFDLCTFSFILSFSMYYYTCRKAARLYYRQTYGQHWLIGAIEYLLLFIPNLFTITVPSATIAAFRVAFGHSTYIVAEKTSSKDKPKIRIGQSSTEE